MTTVQSIHDFLNALAPEHLAEEWDHIGLLCGHSDREVTRVLIALDPFEAACREAKALNCQLLLTHHPAIWSLQAVNNATPAGRNLLFLIENGIAALNAHTNLDYASGGVNDCLAAQLGLRDILPLDLGDGKPLLRGGAVDPCTSAQFAQQIKIQLGCEGLRYADGGREIRRVAVGGGACADALVQVAALGYDAFVTADVKYNGFADAAALGITLLDAGHFQTENPVCAYLAAQLSAAFPDLTVYVSKNHSDCIKFA